MDATSGELVAVTDASGNKHQFLKYDGRYFPEPRHVVNFHENTKRLHELTVNEKDVLILAYEKSGTHWVYELVGMLLNGTTDTIDQIKEMRMLDVQPMDQLNSLPSPRILNSHYWPNYLPLELLEKCRIVHILRNPKDVAVSKYNHVYKLLPRSYDGKFNDFVELFLESKVQYGSWFEHVREFEDFYEVHPELNPLILYYEDIIKTPIDGVRRLAKHLNVEYPKEFLKAVADECHIDKMRVNNETKRVDLTAKFTEDGKSAMYRKGKVGDWKNWFTVANNEKFDAVFKERMKGSRLKFVFEL